MQSHNQNMSGACLTLQKVYLTIHQMQTEYFYYIKHINGFDPWNLVKHLSIAKA